MFIYLLYIMIYIYACDAKGKISLIDFSGLNNNSSYFPEINQFRGKISLR